VTEIDPHWYESFFETEDWLALALARDAERTAREVEFLAERLAPGSRVLDLACGTGRVAVPLAQRGYDVAGIDISERALGVARHDGPGLDLRRGDMRDLPWEAGSFGAVINMWSAFGYFPTKADDERVLAEVARVLAPGGVLVVDTVNQAAFVHLLQPRSWSELDNGTLFCEQRDYDLTRGRARVRWLFVDDRGRRELSFEHRLYTIAEYGELLEGAGFMVTAVLGDLDGSPPSVDLMRVMIVAQRDAA
jgi:SAM-dependent methyltransferase